MKIPFALAVVVCFTAHAQLSNSPLRIVSFQSGTLQWSNKIFAPWPVYQVLAANTVTGAWLPKFSVTNQTSALLSNMPGASAVFSKLNWNYSNDAHMVFDYVFDEGYGVPADVGTLDLNSSVFLGGTSVGSWNVQDYFCIDCLHPTGAHNFASGVFDWSALPHVILLNFTAGSERVYLIGEMETTIVNGRPVYTGMFGDVYLSGFSGTDLIGTFGATRR